LNANLTLSPPARNSFQHQWGFNLHTGNITVSGGVSPMDVIYNISPTGSVGTMAPTTAVGILLAF
jgi:hypothetical protein